MKKLPELEPVVLPPIAKKPSRRGGRAKGQINLTTKEMRDLAQSYAHEAIGTIVATMRTTLHEQVRISCAEIILDRSYGKSTQPIETQQQTELRIIEMTREEMEESVKRLNEKY